MCSISGRIWNSGSLTTEFLAGFPLKTRMTGLNIRWADLGRIKPKSAQSLSWCLRKTKSNKKKSVFYKICIWLITHHLRRAKITPLPQWNSPHSTLFIHRVKPQNIDFLKNLEFYMVFCTVLYSTAQYSTVLHGNLLRLSWSTVDQLNEAHQLSLCWGLLYGWAMTFPQFQKRSKGM